MTVLYDEAGRPDISDSIHREDESALAIVGVALEFPDDVTSSEKFRQMILEGRCPSTDIPRDRMNIDSFYHPDESRASTVPVQKGHFVKEDIRTFDAPFFSITPGEASSMDPQHRRTLETAYHALEDAGIPIEKCTGSNTSVYTGCFINDYHSILAQDMHETEQRHTAVGIATTMLANRLSWFFNFKGTSMNVDTACSSSLVALHLACQDLRSGASSMSLVGGANLIFHPNFMKIMSSSSLLSPDGRCWSFDERANGYARGEGTAVMVIKRVEDAIRDGDTIRAVIRNTGSNQDGKTPSITQPSSESQVALIEQTYRQAGLDMEPTRFFEAHGTGTATGDPTEAHSIGHAFRHCRSKSDPIYVGAVKANVGHLEGASGIAGVIKAILVLENGIIPPIAGLERLNPRIDAENLGLCVRGSPVCFRTGACLPLPLTHPRSQSNLHAAFEIYGISPFVHTPFQSQDLKNRKLMLHSFLERRSLGPQMAFAELVNSFGFGGTNATAILDDAHHYLLSRGLLGHTRTHVLPSSVESTAETRNRIPQDSASTERNGMDAFQPGKQEGVPKLLVMSAAAQKACEEVASQYRQHIETSSPDINQLAYALAKRRTSFPWRSFVIADTHGTTLHEECQLTSPVRAGSDPRVAFIFTGQGAQYQGMGSELSCYPIFRKSLEALQCCLESLGATWSLQQFIDGKESSISIDEPCYSQPLTTCLQIALVDLMKSLGVLPTVVLGHSSGEIAAAYAAGGLSMGSAVKVAYYRGLLSSQLAKKRGNLSMMAVGLSVEVVTSYLDRLKDLIGDLRVWVGCINSPRSVTLTGDVMQLEILQRVFDECSIFARTLRVPIAYHSPVMHEVSLEYHKAMNSLEPEGLTEPIPMISSVTKDIVPAGSLHQPDYWIKNLTSPVEFHGALAKILAQAGKGKLPRKHLGRKRNVDLSITHILEIGPHGALRGPIAEASRDLNQPTPLYIPVLDRKTKAHQSFLAAIGRLHCAGFPVDLKGANLMDEVPFGIPQSLPLYPFNHSQSYWKEGRLSKNLRFRPVARHDLLGTRVLDWNKDVAQWRNTIRLSECPWIRDHKVDGQIVFPGAAMVAIAIEAFRQLNNSGLVGIRIKDVEFSRALVFGSQSNEVETQFVLYRTGPPSKRSSWSHFRLFSVEDEHHTECCSGFIQGDFSQGNDGARPSLPLWVNTQELIDEVKNLCKPEQSPYNLLKKSAVQYGPSFQVVEGIQQGSRGQAVATISTNRWRDGERTDQNYEQFTIHPCTLDGIAQVVLISLFSTQDEMPSMVPKRISSIWIDCRNDALSSEGKILGASKCTHLGRRSASANIVSTTPSLEPVAVLEGLEVSFIESTMSQGEADAKRILCTRMKWRPDIDILSPEQLMEEISRERPSEPDCTVRQFNEMNLAIFCFMEEAVQYLQTHPLAEIPEYLIRYTLWMKYQQSLERNQNLLVAAKQLLNSPKEREWLIARVEASGVEGQFSMQVGRRLISVLTGDTDPLDLIFRSNLVDLFYEQKLANPYHAFPASVFIDHLCFKNPSINILEIGAGTGGQTLRALETIALDGIKRCEKYVYTDISPAFFPRAQAKFGDYADILEYKVCDISKDPTTQSFEKATYDLVIASHVLHATNDIGESLRNIRTLLKPGGRLLLFETTDPDVLSISFEFGLLKGWWSPLDHEPRSTYSPCLTTGQWNDSLKDNGFSGVDLEIPGQEHPDCRFSSILVSSAVPLEHNGTLRENDVFVVRNPSSPRQNHVAGLIAGRWSTSIFTLEEISKVQISQFTTVVFLIELRETFLANISAPDFDLLRSALVATQNVIWITEHVQPTKTPDLSLVEGLGRSIASEESSRRFITLTLDESATEGQVLNLLSKATHSIQNDPINSMETSYSCSRGLVEIPRLCADTSMNNRVSSMLSPHAQVEREISPHLQASLQIGSLDSLKTLDYCEEDWDYSTSTENQVVLNVRAIGLTAQDCRSATGEIDQSMLGTECAGVVQKAGAETSYKPGDRVFVIGQGLARTSVCVDADAVAPVPVGTSFSEAASLPTSLWLAFHSLHKLACLEAGEWVLVLQATSSVGQVMVQMALKMGAHVLATVSSTAKRQFLCDRFGLASDMVFLSDDASIHHSVQSITESSGIDIVVGSLASWYGPDLTDSLAAYARVIDIGTSNSGRSPWEPEERAVNISRASLNLTNLLQQKPAAVYRTFRQAVQLWFEGSVIMKPLILHHFAASEVESAFSQLQKRERIGKVVVEMEEGMRIKVKSSTKPSYDLCSHSSYVISGGLGGLGRRFARWMVSRGARYLILLSRSGPQSPEAQKLIHELEEQGATLATPQVDVGNINALKDVLAELSKSMPPIRGCIQGAIALRDNLFQNMSYEDWKISTAAKVDASWNLHLAMPADLDFFILLSSVNGIFGGRAQANYAAGNSFQDALAHYRISLGQKAVAMDLGLMVNNGILAENESLLNSVSRFGHLMEIKDEELIALLDFYCNPQLPLLSRDDVQPVIGLEMPSVITAFGVDLHHSMRRPMFNHTFRMALDTDSGTSDSGASKGSTDRPAALKKASEQEAVSMVTEWIAHKLGQILGRSETEIETDTPFHANGIDSLVAVDMKNWFLNELGVNITVFDIMGNTSIKQMSAMVAKNSRFRQ